MVQIKHLRCQAMIFQQYDKVEKIVIIQRSVTIMLGTPASTQGTENFNWSINNIC